MVLLVFLRCLCECRRRRAQEQERSSYRAIPSNKPPVSVMPARAFDSVPHRVLNIALRDRRASQPSCRSSDIGYCMSWSI